MEPGGKRPRDDDEPRSTSGREGPYRLAPYSFGRLVYRGGCSRLGLSGDSSLGALYDARFEGPEPTISERDGTVSVRAPKAWPWQWHKIRGDILLRADIPWEVEFRGGVSELDARLGGVALRSFEIRGGASEITLELGRPQGLAVVRVTGGVSDFTLRRPVGVGVRLRIHGGASELTLDEFHFGAVGGQLRWESHGFAEAEQRFDLEISGGASQFHIGTHRSGPPSTMLAP